MIRSLFSAAAGMQAQQLKIDTVSHNLANVSTTGFKKVRVEFQELLYEQLRAPVGGQPLGIFVGHGVRPAATQRFFNDGALQATDSPYDLAIQGPGFFRLQQPDRSEVYSRAGAFRLDAYGQLVSSNGGFLLAGGLPVQVPDRVERVDVTPDGTLTAVHPDGEVEELGTIDLVTFPNPAGLLSLGENAFLATAASGEPEEGQPGMDGFGRVLQGYLELSNVAVVEEMVALIVAQRAYEINSKAVKGADEVLGMANNLRR